MKTLRVFIATALIVCLTSAVPVFAKCKTTHRSAAAHGMENSASLRSDGS